MDLEKLKGDALAQYRRFRDRIIIRYLNRLRKEVKAGGDRTRFDLLSKAYWNTRFFKREFRLDPKNWTRHYDGYPKPLPKFEGPIVMDPASPDYGMLPEGWYFMILDGVDHLKAVRFKTDEYRRLVIKSYDE